MHRHAYITTLLLACTLAVPVVNVGCAGHRYARVYDPDHRDYHRWGPDEDAYYHRWETENHKPHRDWAQRNAEEQKEYWAWRHGGHGDRDKRNHDKHDHDKH